MRHYSEMDYFDYKSCWSFDKRRSFPQHCGGERTVADKLEERCLCLPAELILLEYRESIIYITILGGNRTHGAAAVPSQESGQRQLPGPRTRALMEFPAGGIPQLPTEG